MIGNKLTIVHLNQILTSCDENTNKRLDGRKIRNFHIKNDRQ